jgi:hypothetical protein
MPISKANAARYPKNWKTEIVPAIRVRSGNRCECMGECGLHHVLLDGYQVEEPLPAILQGKAINPFITKEILEKSRPIKFLRG